MEKQKEITHLNFAKGFRGGERQTLLLIKELAKRGYKQRLCMRKNPEFSDRVGNINNLQVIMTSKPFLLSLRKVKGSKIIHAHETKGAQFAYISYLMYKIPYLITRRVDNPIRKMSFNKHMYQNALATVVLSSSIKNELMLLNEKIECHIIPSASSELKVDLKRSSKLKEQFHGKYIIGNIGELHNDHKGQYYLIKAAKNLSRKFPNMLFIFLGKGIDEKRYRVQAQGYQNIIFAGFVDNVADYISIFDLFVFPSLHEGLGSILFDVMEKRVPIIATNVGGIPDIIKDNENGVLINPMSDVEIENEIERLYKEKEFCKKISDKAYLDSQNFTIEKMADRYVELYKF